MPATLWVVLAAVCSTNSDPREGGQVPVNLPLPHDSGGAGAGAGGILKKSKLVQTVKKEFKFVCDVQYQEQHAQGPPRDLRQTFGLRDDEAAQN